MIIINARFLSQKTTGVQRFATEICRELIKLDKTIIFVCPHDILNIEAANEFNAKIIGKNTGTIWEQVDLRRYLAANNNPLLINFCNTGVLSYKNQIVTIHDMSYKVNPKWFSKKFYFWYNIIIPNLVKNSLSVLTVSNSSKNDIVQYLKINPDKINVVYNATNFNGQIIYDIPEKEKYLLSVSSLDPRKNLNNLIKAYKLIDKKIRLIIVGLKSDNFGSALNEDLLDENISIKGYVTDDELGALMQHAEAFIYVSLYEGFGLPPIEAMAMNCPVIVSAIPVHKEVCGDAALYADPNNVEDIRNKIDALVLNDKTRTELIDKGKVNIQRFSWAKSAQKTLQIIKEYI